MIVSKEGASTTVIEVANVFRDYGDGYLQKFSKRILKLNGTVTIIPFRVVNSRERNQNLLW